MNEKEELRPVRILLVEDNPADIRLTQEMLQDVKLLNRLTVVSDGMEAMEYLRKEGKYADVRRPDIILLDLNLPRKDGREVLAEIKRDRQLRRIPVVILTMSKAEEDIARSYDLAANCYITKPIDLEQFTRVVQAIKHFWFSIVTLPPEDSE